MALSISNKRITHEIDIEIPHAMLSYPPLTNSAGVSIVLLTHGSMPK
jgi:hypothetical protein